MKVQIAVATIAHAPEIANVAAEALTVGIEAESPHVQRVLDAGCTFVAIAEGDIVGFVSCFITRDEQDCGRFELDLLGVAPAWQGRGIGAQLVDTSLQAARESSATTIRALVRCDNMPMQRICARSGLTRSEQAYQLWVNQANQPAGSRASTYAARIIAVDTLTYGGYWLEGELSQSAIDTARTMLWVYPDGSNIGAVVPEQDRGAIDLLRANSFDRFGAFHWWTLRL